MISVSGVAIFMRDFDCTGIFRTFEIEKWIIMETSIARFDTRLPKEQKEFFKFAAGSGSFF
jgi:hypothetical protein